jgi:hypothetical protein
MLWPWFSFAILTLSGLLSGILPAPFAGAFPDLHGACAACARLIAAVIA